MPTSPETRDKILLLLVSGMAESAVREAAGKLGLEAADIDVTIDECRARITSAANYERPHQIGQAIVRLNDCYRRALAVQDTKTALAAAKELAKLQALYTAPPPTLEDAGTEGNAELAAIRAHLLPLDLGTEADSTEELARRAALRILALDNQPKPQRRKPHVHRRKPPETRPPGRRAK